MAQTISAAAQNHNSFFKSLQSLFFIGALSGVLPLSGIYGPLADLRFSWKNGWVIYSAIIFAFAAFLNIIHTVENVGEGIQLDNFGSTVFYTVCNLNTIFFVGIAYELPQLCREIAHLEKAHLVTYGYPKTANLRIKVYLGIFLVLAVVEHSFLTVYHIVGAIGWSTNEDISFLEAFYRSRFGTLSTYINDRSGFLGIFAAVLNVICTINWNYLDFFIACVSMQLSAKFAQFGSALRQMTLTEKDDLIWRKLQDDYNQLSVMTKKIDAKLSKMVLMSYGSNLYHLALQLLRAIKLKGSVVEMTYFYFSLFYLILRMLSVSLCGAQIQEESRAPKQLMYAIREPCPAASRLLHQVTTDDIHISGKNFFTVNRRFVISMIGTLITYEVVLLQLNSLRYDDSA